MTVVVLAFLAGVAVASIPARRAMLGARLEAELARQRVDAAEPVFRAKGVAFRIARSALERARRGRAT